MTEAGLGIGVLGVTRHGFPADALPVDVLLALLRSGETLVYARNRIERSWKKIPGRVVSPA